MKDQKQIPHLIDLLDDPSEEIRSSILKALEAYGVTLEEDLQSMSIQLDDERKSVLRELFEKNDRAWLRGKWPGLTEITDPIQKLEEAMSLIASFQYGRNYPVKAGKLLDKLTHEYFQDFRFGDPYDLSNFLFQHKRLKGAVNDYYNPMNSNIVYAIEAGQAIPITLVIIYMLVGNRLGLEIEGCNFPGHFLARFHNPQNEIVLVDCYNGGRFIFEEDLEELEKQNMYDIIKLAYEITPIEVIIRRVLNNLSNAYKRNGDPVTSEFFDALAGLQVT